VAQLVVGVGRGVLQVNAKGHIHRDLKPLNILLDAHKRPLVADLGIACRSNVTTFLGKGTPGRWAARCSRQGGMLDWAAWGRLGRAGNYLIVFHPGSGSPPRTPSTAGASWASRWAGALVWRAACMLHADVALARA
jgi:serine/threonine protein kinase